MSPAAQGQQLLCCLGVHLTTIPVLASVSALALPAQIFSCFLPNISLERTSSWAKDQDDRSFSFDDSAILIKRGVLVHGAQGLGQGRPALLWRRILAVGALRTFTAPFDGAMCSMSLDRPAFAVIYGSGILPPMAV